MYYNRKKLMWMAKKNFPFRLQSFENTCLYSHSLYLWLECVSIPSDFACSFILKKNLLNTYYVPGRLLDIGDIDQVPALTQFTFSYRGYLIGEDRQLNLNLMYII